MLTGIGSHQRDGWRIAVNGHKSLLVGWLLWVSTCLLWDSSQWVLKLLAYVSSLWRNLSINSTVRFYEINFSTTIWIIWRDKNLWTRLLQHSNPHHYNEHKSRTIFFLNHFHILPSCLFVCQYVLEYVDLDVWKGRIFPAVTPLNGLGTAATQGCMLRSSIAQPAVSKLQKFIVFPQKITTMQTTNVILSLQRWSPTLNYTISINKNK